MRAIGFLIYPGYSVMALAMAAAFESADELAGAPCYALHFLSVAGGGIRTSSGMVVATEAFDDRGFDTLIIGGATVPEPSSAGVIALVQAAAARCRRIAAVCTGAFVLAEAGLLDDREVTTHWRYARELQQRFPRLRVAADRIFVNDGAVWTSAGMTAGLDLALALIESDFGPALAKAVARKLVVYHRRGGGQSQFSALLELAPKSDRIQSALAYARENLDKPLHVPELAAAAHLSPRQFSRAFHAETGQSPAKAVEGLRVEAARALMEHSRHPMEVIARQTGFSDGDQMRRAFLRAFGQPPQVLRRNARLPAAAREATGSGAT